MIVTSVYYSCYSGAYKDQEDVESQIVTKVVSKTRKSSSAPQERRKSTGNFFLPTKAKEPFTSTTTGMRRSSHTGSFRNRNHHRDDHRYQNPTISKLHERQQAKLRISKQNRQITPEEKVLTKKKNGEPKENVRCDLLYKLGKESMSKRSMLHELQKTEKERRSIEFENGLKKKRSTSQSCGSSLNRAMLLYELSRPKQMEGKLRREALSEKMKERRRSWVTFADSTSFTSSSSCCSSSLSSGV